MVAAFGAELPAKAFSNLGSHQFREREAAQLELLQWARANPEPAMTELLKESYGANDPEVRERCLNVLRDLVMDEYLNEGKGYIGIGLREEIANVPGDPKPRSVIRVTNVQPGSPGERAGLKFNDLVVGLEREIWYETNARPLFQQKIMDTKPNTEVVLKVLRNDEPIDITVKLIRRPVIADTLPFNAPNVDPEGPERAAKEAYFRLWLSERKSRK